MKFILILIIIGLSLALMQTNKRIDIIEHKLMLEDSSNMAREMVKKDLDISKFRTKGH